MPLHEFALGVTLIVAVIGELELFAAGKAAIAPFPVAGIPIVGESFVHE